MLPRGQLFLPAAPTRPASYAIRARAAGPRAPAIRPPRGPPTPRPPAPFKPSRIDPLNREPATKPAPTAPFKRSRTDPLNREPRDFPDIHPRPVHRVHDPAHIREPTRRAAHTEPAPQARNLCRGRTRMNADKLVSRLRDWLNALVSHRHICVICGKNSFLLDHSAPAEHTRQGPGPAHPHPAAKPGPTAPSKPSRTDPLNREPTAKIRIHAEKTIPY